MATMYTTCSSPSSWLSWFLEKAMPSWWILPFTDLFETANKSFFMGMLSPYSLFILYNRYTEAMCLVPKNIVKTGCVYSSDHLIWGRLFKFVPLYITCNVTFYKFVQIIFFYMQGVKYHADLLNFRKIFPMTSCGFRR